MDGPNNRVIKEVLANLNDPLPGVRKFQPDPQNFRHFWLEIQGPSGSLYEGGIFKLEMFLPQNYPFSFPKIIFKTYIYHPYIDPKQGLICIQLFDRYEWTPVKQIKFALADILKLMSNPDKEGRYNLDATEHWRKNKREAEQKAREDTLKYAKQTS